MTTHSSEAQNLSKSLRILVEKTPACFLGEELYKIFGNKEIVENLNVSNAYVTIYAALMAPGGSGLNVRAIEFSTSPPFKTTLENRVVIPGNELMTLPFGTLTVNELMGKYRLFLDHQQSIDFSNFVNSQSYWGGPRDTSGEVAGSEWAKTPTVVYSSKKFHEEDKETRISFVDPIARQTSSENSALVSFLVEQNADFATFKIESIFPDSSENYEEAVHMPNSYCKNLTQNELVSRIKITIDFCEEKGTCVSDCLRQLAMFELSVGKIPEPYVEKFIPPFLSFCQMALRSKDMYISEIGGKKCLATQNFSFVANAGIKIVAVQPSEKDRQALIKKLMGYFVLGGDPSVPFSTFFKSLKRIDRFNDSSSVTSGLER